MAISRVTRRYLAEIGSRGGSVRSPKKRSTPEHYDRMVAASLKARGIRRGKRAVEGKALRPTNQMRSVEDVIAYIDATLEDAPDATVLAAALADVREALRGLR
jgi:hypothetical protein